MRFPESIYTIQNIFSEQQDNQHMMDILIPYKSKCVIIAKTKLGNVHTFSIQFTFVNTQIQWHVHCKGYNSDG